MRRYLALFEATAYSAKAWRRWWVNTRDGQIRPITTPDHDSYLFTNLDDFFSEDEIDDIMSGPSVNADAPEDAYEPHDRIDDFLIAAYKKGWQAMLYDGNQQMLSLRSYDAPMHARVIAEIARQIMGEIPVRRLVFDLYNDRGQMRAVELQDTKLERFLKTGKIQEGLDEVQITEPLAPSKLSRLLSDVSKEKHEKIGKLGPYEVTKATHWQPGHTYYAVLDKGKIIAALDVGTVPAGLRIPGERVNLVGVRKSYQGKGIVSQLYLFLVNQLGLTLIADFQWTAGGKALWRKIAASGQVQIWRHWVDDAGKYHKEAVEDIDNDDTTIFSMTRHGLQEDTAADVSQRKIADKAAMMVTDYLYQHEPDRYIQLGDFGEYAMVKPDTLGWTQAFGFDDVLVLIGRRDKRAIGVSGQVVSFTPPLFNQYRTGIVIHCLDELTPEEVKRGVNSVETLKVAKHEIQHYLDARRTGGKAVARDSDPRDRAAYYNDPAEFNAYYHDLADRLTTFLHDSEGASPEDIRDLASLYDISPDFKRTIQQVTSGGDRATARFYKWLSTDRRKALLRRLYQLHQRVRGVLAAAG